MLKGGAFFIPLNADDSALPATFFNIEIKNISLQNVKVSLAGWLELKEAVVLKKDHSLTIELLNKN